LQAGDDVEDRQNLIVAICELGDITICHDRVNFYESSGRFRLQVLDEGFLPGGDVDLINLGWDLAGIESAKGLT
jgi:hypothetical protein